MNPVNITKSPPPPPASDLLAKRKRGRPRKDEASTQQEKNSHVTPKQPDVNLVGKMVTGVVESAFDAGYLLNVKVKDSDTVLRGLVFIPGKVKPITPENDVAPNVKMYGREEFKNNQTDQSHTDHDQHMEDAAQALFLLPQASNGQREAMNKEKDGVMEEAETRLVEFFPTPVTMMTAQVPNPVVVEKETEQQIPPGETRGFDLMAEKPVGPGEKVPEELQLELGNKTIILSGDNSNNNIATTRETDPKTSVSKSGFIANLFEGVDKKSDCDMEEDKAEEATPSVQ